MIPTATLLKGLVMVMLSWLFIVLGVRLVIEYVRYVDMWDWKDQTEPWPDDSQA